MPTPITKFLVGIKLNGTDSIGIKLKVRNTRTGQSQEVTTGTSADAQCDIGTANSNFSSDFQTGDLIEVFRADGSEYGYATFTVPANKAGIKLTLASTAKSSSTHASVSI